MIWIALVAVIVFLVALFLLLSVGKRKPYVPTPDAEWSPYEDDASVAHTPDYLLRRAVSLQPLMPRQERAEVRRAYLAQLESEEAR